MTPATPEPPLTTMSPVTRVPLRLAAGALALLLATATPPPVGAATEASVTSTTGAINQAPPGGIDIKLRLPGAQRVWLVQQPSGDLAYLVHWKDGRSQSLDPHAFTRLLYGQNTHRPWLFQVLNITTPLGVAWVSIGLLGQVLFTGRMIVQWLASEKSRRSVVPVAFWWMSLAGSSMLVVYFIWRRDIVGVLGQCTGWAIYVRNLLLIHRHARLNAAPSPATSENTASPR